MTHSGISVNLTSYSISEHVYGDEQSAFDCNTKETGCPNACYSGESLILPRLDAVELDSVVNRG